MNLKDGKGTIHIKGGYQGKPSIVAASEDSESTKLQFEFYVSKSQKRTMNQKLSSIVSKKGFSGITEVIDGKSLKSTSVVSGSANIEEILQKIDTGELEIEDYISTTNSDGSVSIKLIIKPKVKIINNEKVYFIFNLTIYITHC